MRLPMQETRVRSLLCEDPTCLGAAKPRAPQLLSLDLRAQKLQLQSPLTTTMEAHAP